MSPAKLKNRKKSANPGGRGGKQAEKTLRFLFEAGALKLIKRSGWWYAKVKDPESVAEHSFRTAVLAFLIAKMEGKGANAEDAAVSALFHDFHETRIEDRNKIQSNYFKTPREAKERAIAEQAAWLPESARRDFERHSLDKSDIVKDADHLECALQAREYYDCGHKSAWEWIERAGSRLKTKSAKALFAELKRTPSDNWWDGLKEKVE